MKHTAVKWLIEQLTEVERNLINKTYLQNDSSLAGCKLRNVKHTFKDKGNCDLWQAEI